MTMVFLVNVPHIETHMGIEFYTPHAHASLDYPCEGGAYYSVIDHMGTFRSWDFTNLADALDYIATHLKQSEPA